MPRTYVSLDMEMTGLDPRRDEIIEIGMVRFRGTEVLETFSSLVHSRRRIPQKIRTLVGITQAEVDAAPSLASLVGEILAFVKSHPLIGHNIEMDLSFLNRDRRLLNNLAIDTFELATILIPEASRYGLSDLATLLDIDPGQHHRALADAVTTKELFLRLVERASGWDPMVLQEITRLAASSDWPLLRFFRDIVAENGGSAQATALLGRRRQRRLSPLTVRESDVEDLPPLEPTPTISALDEEELAAILSPGGTFERSFEGYEYRPQQVDMLRGVVEAMNIPTHLLAEAGTGVGKSLAYLIPAIYFAVQNGRRVVVSSNTINLQDQLYSKDIPDLERCLPISFSTALLKGRNNYLCMRRLSVLRRSRQLSVPETRVLAKILAWLPITQTGDRSELLLYGQDRQAWGKLGATSEMCIGDRCPFLRTGQCFFFRARARAERAHLVIINHALMLSDLALESRVLPEYGYLIVDEAHHLEEQATNHFGFEVGREAMYAFLIGLSHRGGDAGGGLLAQIPRLFQQEGVGEAAQKAVGSIIETIAKDVDTAQRRLHQLFDVLTKFLADQQGRPAEGKPSYDQRTRLTSGLRVQPDWSNVEIEWENLSGPLMRVINGLEHLLRRVESLELGEDMERDELVQEIRGYLLRGHEMWGGLEKILMSPDDQSIYWISVSRRTDSATLHSAPLHVGPTLQDRLFAEKECVILTSATLRTGTGANGASSDTGGATFDYLEERLGLEDPIELALDSPFDFKTAVLLYVPNDLPEPNQPYYQKSVEDALIDLCRAAEGRTLALFTSNSQLYSTYYAIQSSLERSGIVIYGQGIDGSRRQILESFRSTTKSVLLGTRSFWEGVDVVGQALSCLVIARLPFSVPTDPIFSARAETFENAFNEYYLPEAILRFRQGFGRLIRSQDDYGVVVVLDRRILTRQYGKTILRSLPGCTARQGPARSLPGVIQRWLDPENRS